MKLVWRVFAVGGPVQDVFQAKRAWGCRRGLVIEAEDSSGRRGQGEIAPLPGVSDESLADVQALLSSSLPEQLPDGCAQDWLSHESSYAAAMERLPDVASLRFAVGTALWNLIAAREETTCGALWGGTAASNLAALIGQRPPAVWDELARHRAAGIKTFKVKVGVPGKLREEVEFLRQLKDRLRPTEALRLDANRSLGSLKDLEALTFCDPEYVEEPFPFELLESLSQSNLLSLPVGLDESLRDQNDPMTRLKGVVAWVIKPTLVGDPLQTLKQAEEALAQGALPVLSHLFDGPVARSIYLELGKAIDARCRDKGVEPAAHGIAPHAAVSALTRTPLSELSPQTKCLSTLEQADLRGDSPAFVTAQQTFSWRRVHEAVQTRVSSLQQSSVASPASFVVLIAGSDYETAVNLAALSSVSAPAILVDARHPRKVREELLAGFEVSVVLDGSTVTQYQPIRTDVLAEDPLFVVFSSGSSGPAKAIGLSRDNLLAAARLQSERLNLLSSDRWVWSLSAAHVGGLMIWARCLVTGAALTEGRPEALFASIEATKATIASAVPAQLAREDAAIPPTSLTTLVLGGAAAPWPMVQKARASGVAVVRSYGATETTAMVASESLADAHRIDGPRVSAGTVLPGVDISIVDERIVVRGPTVARVLDSTGDAFASNDRGKFDKQGNLLVLGRRDLVIISGGENVNPEQVEAALETLPFIEAALVFGREDPKWGAIVSACLVGEPCSLATLRKHIQGSLAPAAVPRAIRFCQELPRSVAGKVKRQEAARAWAAADQPPTE